VDNFVDEYRRWMPQALYRRYFLPAAQKIYRDKTHIKQCDNVSCDLGGRRMPLEAAILLGLWMEASLSICHLA
jgi:hypothetical protein